MPGSTHDPLPTSARAHDGCDAAIAHERAEIAAELHDSVAQSLAYFRLRLPLLHDAIAAGDRERALGLCAQLRDAVNEAHVALRHILADFRAPAPGGLAAAIRTLAGEIGARGTLEVTVDLPDACDLAPEQARHALRVVQEALANVERHAGARHAWVRMTAGPQRIAITIEDDGRGIAGSQQSRGDAHFGLDIMRSRATRLAGALALDVRPGGGTLVGLEFPR